jgi:O-antigen/teichoic acid export membrane protein
LSGSESSICTGGIGLAAARLEAPFGAVDGGLTAILSPVTEEASLEETETVTRSTLVVLLTYVGTAGFTAVLTLYLVRAIGPRGYGVFALALSVGGLLALPADFGIAGSATRFIAERRGDRAAAAALFGSAGRLKIMVAGVLALLTVALAEPIAAAYHEPRLTWPLRAMALAVLFQSLLGLFSGMFIAVGRTTVNLRMIVSESAVEFSASLLLVLAGAGAAGAAWGRAIGYFVGCVVGLVLAARLLGPRAAALHRRGVEMRRMLRYAGALMIVNGAFSLFSNLDALLIGAILSTTAVGAFSAPLRLTAVLGYPGLALANTVGPRVARVEGASGDYAIVQASLRLQIVVYALMIAPLAVWARPIVDLLLGSDYRGSVGVLRWMAPFVFLQGMGQQLALTTNYLGAAKRRIPVALAAVAVNFAIDLALLGPLGVKAAAIGTSAAYAVYVGGHFAICRHLLQLRVRDLALSLARSLAAAAAMALVLLAFGTEEIGPVSWVAGLVAATAAFVAVLFATREVTVAELRALRR